MSALSLRCLSFTALSNDELYALLRLRSEVFVVEQDCVFLDMDDSDQQALHVLGETDRGLMAYARLLPPGAKYPQASSIGRVVSSLQARRDGHGRTLMAYCIECCQGHWPEAEIRISAQQYLEAFYSSFGFEVQRGPYLEDGIPHLEMRLK